MSTMTLLVSAAILLWAAGTQAYPSFSAQFPNGDRVPHPCNQAEVWKGVGHTNPMGGGARNQFGVDFKSAGYQWSNLCSVDSDGDGLTNGEELGDPRCVWTQGSPPERTVNISHPGICDPYDSPTCLARNTFLECEQKSAIERCQTIKKPETQSLDLRFPVTEVPNTETNYFCMTFDLPSDQDYHIKAYEAIMDNMNVLHHILVFGCEESDSPVDQVPGACNMNTEECNAIIGLWAVGVDGKCYDEDIGFRFGNTSFKRVKLELHWNNPTRHAGWTDSSGMRIYYQPATDQVQDMVSFMTGQMVIAVPPHEPHVTLTSTCTSGCTSALISKPAYVAGAINHMHYLGKEMSIQVFRGGRLLKNLTNDKYDYDSPTDVSFQPHFQVLPGDEIKTTCVFNSMGRDRWTFYGEGTSDEMCFGFLLMYPRDAFPYTESCTSYGPLDPCAQYDGQPMGNCNWRTFTNFTHPETRAMVEELEHNCNLDGYCRPECHEISKRINQHPCMIGEAGQTIKFFLGLSMDGIKLMSRVNSCQKEDRQTCKKCECDHDHGSDFVGDDVRDSATGNTPLHAAILSAVALATVSWLGYIRF